MTDDLLPCPACGQQTLKGLLESCGEWCCACHWEVDPEALEKPDELLRPNYVSLNQARRIVRVEGIDGLRARNVAGGNGVSHSISLSPHLHEVLNEAIKEAGSEGFEEAAAAARNGDDLANSPLWDAVDDVTSLIWYAGGEIRADIDWNDKALLSMHLYEVCPTYWTASRIQSYWEELPEDAHERFWSWSRGMLVRPGAFSEALATMIDTEWSDSWERPRPPHDVAKLLDAIAVGKGHMSRFTQPGSESDYLIQPDE